MAEKSAPATTVTWQQKVESANSQMEIIQVARDFLAQLDPLEVALLPPQCAPRKLVDAEDVCSYAFDLVGHYCDRFDEAAKIVQRLAAFFTHASIRLSELAIRTNDEEDASRRSA